MRRRWRRRRRSSPRIRRCSIRLRPISRATRRSNKQDSIARQQVEDQQFARRAGQGGDRRRPGADRHRQAQHRLLPHRRAGQRPRRPAARRPRQLPAAVRLDRHRRHHPNRSDQRRLLHRRGQSAADRGAAEERRQAAGRPRSTAPTSSSWRPGRLTTFDNQIDTHHRHVQAAREFDNADGALFPNQFVNVRLLVDTMTGARSRPTRRSRSAPTGSFVYVVKADSTVAVRKVTTGPADAKNTVILSGLTAGENVVIDGVDRLRDGAKVVVRNGGGAAASAPADASGAAPRQQARARTRARRAERRPERRRRRRRRLRRRDSSGGARGDEPVPPLHRTAGRDDAADVRHPDGRRRRLSLPAAVGAARGRLSDHPGADLLSRREPGGDDLVGDGAAGAPVRPDAEPDADDVAEFGRLLGHHPALRPRHRPRHRRAGGAGGDQRRGQPAARPTCRRRRSTPRSTRPTRRSSPSASPRRR